MSSDPEPPVLTHVHEGRDPDMPKGAKSGRAMHGKTAFASLRKAVHNGHQITIKTTYRIEIDGKPVQMPVSVTNDGMVQYHGLPNYSFRSAIDLAKAIIDAQQLLGLPVPEPEPQHGHSDHPM